MKLLRLQANCVPGLEPLMHTEMRALRLRDVRTDGSGKVRARGTLRQLYAANAFLRCASRIFLDVGSITARNHNELQLKLGSLLRFAPFLPDDAALAIRVRVRRGKARPSGLHHESNIREHLHELLRRPPAAAADGGTTSSSGGGGYSSSGPRIDVDVDGHRVSFLVDTSGDVLHERGWRRGAGKMPLKGSVAAGLLYAAGWTDAATSDAAQPLQRRPSLIDPFCGSGSIPIEAAQMALGLPPRPERTFALHRWPAFEPAVWASVAGEVAERTGAAARRQRTATRPLAGECFGLLLTASDCFRPPAGECFGLLRTASHCFRPPVASRSGRQRPRRRRHRRRP